MRCYMPLAILVAVCVLNDHSIAGDTKSVGDVIARFEKGDPDWKVRVRSLQTVVKAGPDAVPILLKTLKRGSPSARVFAAQSLELVVGPQHKPALRKLLSHADPEVRVYAVRALGMLGKVELTEEQQSSIGGENADWMLIHYITSMLNRDVVPAAAPIRQALIDYDLNKIDTARVGHLAPDFILADNDGNLHRLSEFGREKTILLDFNTGNG